MRWLAIPMVNYDCNWVDTALCGLKYGLAAVRPEQMNFIHIGHQFNILMGFGFDIRIEQRRQGVNARAEIQKGFFAEGFDDIYRGIDER